MMFNIFNNISNTSTCIFYWRRNASTYRKSHIQNLESHDVVSTTLRRLRESNSQLMMMMMGIDYCDVMSKSL